MLKTELLNNITHKDLRIITRKGKVLGDAVGNTLTFPTEFAQVQREYPILFRKNAETGEFQSVVLFGFEKDQNLFLDDDGWHADYIPAVMQRDPFLIGFSIDQADGETRIPMIHVSMDSPRISKNDDGEPVFLPHGGNTPYIDKVGKMLHVIYDGMEASKSMFALFAEMDLLEPVTLDIELDKGQVYQLRNYYVIHEEKLAMLNDAALGRLHRSGFLRAAYFAIASIGNIQKLVDKCNQRFSFK